MSNQVTKLANKIKDDPAVALKVAHIVNQLSEVGDMATNKTGDIVQPPWYRMDKKKKIRIASIDVAVAAKNLINEHEG